MKQMTRGWLAWCVSVLIACGGTPEPKPTAPAVTTDNLGVAPPTVVAPDSPRVKAAPQPPPVQVKISLTGLNEQALTSLFREAKRALRFQPRRGHLPRVGVLQKVGPKPAIAKTMATPKITHAFAVLRALAEKKHRHRLGVDASILLLDTWVALHRYEDAYAMAKVLARLKGYTEKKDPKLWPRLDQLLARGELEACVLKGQGRPGLSAARCYAEKARNLSSNSRTKRFAAEAYFNAAVIFHQGDEVTAGLKALLHIVNDLPETELAPKALWLIAKTLHAEQSLSQAMRAYGQFAKMYPNHEKTTLARARFQALKHAVAECRKTGRPCKTPDVP